MVDRPECPARGHCRLQDPGQASVAGRDRGPGKTRPAPLADRRAGDGHPATAVATTVRQPKRRLPLPGPPTVVCESRPSPTRGVRRARLLDRYARRAFVRCRVPAHRSASLTMPHCLPACCSVRGFVAPQGHSCPPGAGRTEAEAAGPPCPCLPSGWPHRCDSRARAPASIEETKDRDDRGSRAGRHG